MMRISLSSVALAFATIATSLATLLFGYGSAPYYVSFLLAAAFAGFSISQSSDRARLATMVMVWLYSIHALILTLQGSLYSTDYPNADLIRLVPVVTVLILGDCARRQTPDQFAQIMRWAALAHIPILISTYYVSRAAVLDGGRLAGENVAVAALAEIAIGTAWAGILSKRKYVSIGAVGAAILIVILTQMRTAGLAVSATLVVLILANLVSMRLTVFRFTLMLIGMGAAVMWISYNYGLIVDTVSTALLLDDPHRGLSSGFSGRFDNFSGGWEQFLKRPLLGWGSTNEIVNYTHNGYIKSLAEFGAPLTAITIAFLAAGLYKSWTAKNYALFAVICGLLLFYMGQPRNINTQICPLVGILACFKALGLERANSPKRSQSMARERLDSASTGGRKFALRFFGKRLVWRPQR